MAAMEAMRVHHGVGEDHRREAGRAPAQEALGEVAARGEVAVLGAHHDAEPGPARAPPASRTARRQAAEGEAADAREPPGRVPIHEGRERGLVHLGGEAARHRRGVEGADRADRGAAEGQRARRARPARPRWRR